MQRTTAAVRVALGEAVAAVQVPTIQPLAAATMSLAMPIPTFPSEPLFINVGLSSKAVTKTL